MSEANNRLQRAWGEALFTVGGAAAAISAPAILTPPREPGKPHFLRDLDILGAENLFDHSANALHGTIIAQGVALAGVMLVSAYVPEERRTAAVITTGTLAAGGGVGVNVAYEAGAPMPIYGQKPKEAPFDAGDALMGSATAILFGTVFCVAALRNKYRYAKRI